MVKFAERIKDLRVERKMSQGDLALILNCSRQAVSNWEVLGKEPSYEVLWKLADYFSVSADYLIGRADF